MTLGPGSLAQYATRQPWMRANAYESGDVAFGASSPLTILDGRGCGDAPAFPGLATSPSAVFSDEMLRRIRQFVLDDGRGRATPCLLQAAPHTTFPQILPLSHLPSGGGDR